VYSKRNVAIPYIEGNMSESVMNLRMSSRATNALLRAGIRTINDVIDFCQANKITKIVNLGRSSGIEVFETILDYCWDHMSQEERVSFLIDTVERNSEYIREEIA
jgi:DNA-directed RNA polymerase alpha subunit